MLYDGHITIGLSHRETIISFLYIIEGEQWIECVPLLQILCLSGAFMPIFSLYQNLVISHGRSDINMWLNIAQIALQLIVILLFYQQGITVMVIAYCCCHGGYTLYHAIYRQPLAIATGSHCRSSLAILYHHAPAECSHLQGVHAVYPQEEKIVYGNIYRHPRL